MNFIKRHKSLILFFVIFIVFLLLLIGIYGIFFKESSDSFYGNRLDGISDVRINEDTLDQIVKEMEETGNVEKADYRLEGKLLNFIVGVNSGLDAAVAKSMGDLILRQLTKEQLGYYDIQFYLLETTSGENSVYPMIGYKHKTSDSFVW